MTFIFILATVGLTGFLFTLIVNLRSISTLKHVTKLYKEKGHKGSVVALASEYYKSLNRETLLLLDGKYSLPKERGGIYNNYFLRTFLSIYNSPEEWKTYLATIKNCTFSMLYLTRELDTNRTLEISIPMGSEPIITTFFSNSKKSQHKISIENGVIVTKDNKTILNVHHLTPHEKELILVAKEFIAVDLTEEDPVDSSGLVPELKKIAEEHFKNQPEEATKYTASEHIMLKNLAIKSLREGANSESD